ncbi:MAG: family hydrolase, partial [Aeromicrobium sp.]|nr:family hydrolase [Aeromicrobium sp.]
MSPTRSAAFFDLDKTIIARSSTLAFGKPFYEGGLLSRRAVLRSAYANFMFAINGAEHDQIEKMRAYMTEMVKVWDVEVVRQAVA